MMRAMPPPPRRAALPPDGPQLLIAAARDADGWVVGASTPDGERQTSQHVKPDSRIGRALEQLARELAKLA